MEPAEPPAPARDAREPLIEFRVLSGVFVCEAIEGCLVLPPVDREVPAWLGRVSEQYHFEEAVGVREELRPITVRAVGVLEHLPGAWGDVVAPDDLVAHERSSIRPGTVRTSFQWQAGAALQCRTGAICRGHKGTVGAGPWTAHRRTSLTYVEPVATGVSPRPASRVLPEGVVALLFSDIEGSTKLLERMGDRYVNLLVNHHRIVRAAVAAHDGDEVDTEGDAFFVVFRSAQQAIAAAMDVQLALRRERWVEGAEVRVRMGIHVGEPVLIEQGYVGMDVHRAARICSAAHGGQVVASEAVWRLAGDGLPEGVGLVDLGDHVLKDLPQPEHLFQLRVPGLPDRFPPLRSLEPPTNVPRFAAEIVGRREELKELKTLLSRGEARLVTLTGPGGIGKTRLGAAVALELRHKFPHGVYFVDLTNLTRPDEVPHAVAGVLEIPLDGDRDAAVAVAAAIADKRQLLLLDNCEQVLGGAVGVAALLKACPGLRVIATSRVVLGLDDEQEYAVPPLGLPRDDSLDAVRNSDAGQLFEAVARRSRREFRLDAHNAAAVARVCTMLDGLPLAIRLAAARVKLFSPKSLAERLGDRLGLLSGGGQDLPERHRTLRAAIDWSFALLGEAERRCFVDFSIFRGGARLATVEAVLGDRYDVLGAVAALVDHSLLLRREDGDGEARFEMLQTIRDYAADARPAGTDAMGLAGAHAQHFLDVVEEALGFDRPMDHATIERDYDNIRAALDFWQEAAERRQPEAAAVKALSMAAELGTYWYRHGMGAEGVERIERALEAAGDAPPRLRAAALRLLGVMREAQRDLGGAEQVLREAAELCRELGDREQEARCLNSLAIVARASGRAADAEALLRQVVLIREEIRNPVATANALNNLALVLADRGELGEARLTLVETLRRDRAIGDPWGIACSSMNLSLVHLLNGDAAQAAPLLREALASFLDLGDLDGVLEALDDAIGLAAVQRRWHDAARLAGASQSARRQLGIARAEAESVYVAQWLREIREALGEEAFEAASGQGATMVYGQAVHYVNDHVLVPDRRDGSGHF